MIETVTGQLQEFLQLGGPVIGLLLVMSVLSIAISSFKFLQFMSVGKALLPIAQNSSVTMDALISVRREFAHSSRPLPRLACLIADILIHNHQGLISRKSAQHAIGHQIEFTIRRLQSGLRALDLIAQLAPLIGLFGTVLGMISAFQALESAGNQIEPSMLAGGIWVALLTTATGLAVAMPTSLFLAFFESRVDGFRTIAETLHMALSSPVYSNAFAEGTGQNAEMNAGLAHV